MPEMDGFQVLEKIKGDPGLRDIPVIVISAVDELDSVVRCIEMGAEDYLPKSYDPVLLRARLGSCLQKKKLRDLEKIYLQQEMMLRQSEKLITLGKLSAGMAHELNNPSAAAQRGAAQLQITFSKLQQTYLRLCRFKLTETQLSMLAGLDQMAQARARKPVYLDALTRSDIERALEDWMEEQKVANAWEIAPTLVSLGYQQAELELLLTSLSSEQFVAAIEWLNASATIYSLAEEISQGAGHISEIVKALKTYTYMDQAPIQTVDIHESLDNTLIILRSKLASGVSVKRDFAADLPKIEAYGSELNQVWTNIIDNAIDAMQGQGEIGLRTSYAYPWVMVQIEDNGPGIPEPVLPHVFDPFFTTKAVGKGTGLGLNISHNIIVQKHHGRLSVRSQPGKTCFEVRLPLRLSAEKE
jgi:signal transduction histidine kinase